MMNGKCSALWGNHGDQLVGMHSLLNSGCLFLLEN